MPEQHAFLSASGAHRWLNCPPSVKLESQFPDKGSESAAEGTLAHKIGENKVLKYLGLMTAQKYRSEFKKLTLDPKYTPEMDTYTDGYLDFIKDRAAEFKSKPSIFVEQEVKFDHIVPEGFGTCDCVIIGSDKLVIVDLKYGKNPQNKIFAKDNPQLMLYALGAINEFFYIHINTVEMCIFQPRLDHIDSYTITREALEAWADSVKPIAEKAYKGEGEYNAGDWCRFCRAKNKCRKYTEYCLQPYEDTNGSAPELLAIDEIGEILKKADAIKKWVTDIEEYALSEILAGNTIPGWKAVEGRSVRQFTDTDAAFKALINSGIDEAVLYERKPIALTAVEKLLGKKDFEAQLSEFIIKPPGKPTLAPETDKRTAITNKTTAAEAFGA